MLWDCRITLNKLMKEGAQNKEKSFLFTPPCVIKRVYCDIPMT